MRKGFTLIELMIVVAIIGILAAIAIPKFADLLCVSKIAASYDKAMEGNSFDKARLSQEKQEAIDAFRNDPESHGKVDNYLYGAFRSGNRYSAPRSVVPKYRLQTGAVVECKTAEPGNGFVNLSDCTDGYSYYAQTNITKLN